MYKNVLPRKSNIDTKTCHFLKGVTFSKPSVWVSMLVFVGVYKNPGDDEPVSWVVDPDARRKGNWMACWNALLLRRR